METRLLPLTFLTAGLVSVLIGISASGSPKWFAAAVVAFLGALPALIVRSPRLYGIAVYLLVLALERNGKSIDKYFVELTNYLDLYGIPPSGAVSIVIFPSDVVLFALAAGCFLHVLMQREKVYWPKITVVIVAFLLWITVASLLKSEVFHLSLVELTSQFRYLFVFLFAANAVDSKDTLRGVVVVLLACLVVESILTIALYASGASGHPLAIIFEPLASGDYGQNYENTQLVREGESAERGRATGTFGTPGRTAMYLEYLIPLAFTLLWFVRGRCVPVFR